MFNQVCGVLRQLSRVHALKGDLSAAASALDQCLHAEILIYGSSSRRAQASRLRLRELIQLVDYLIIYDIFLFSYFFLSEFSCM